MSVCGAHCIVVGFGCINTVSAIYRYILVGQFVCGHILLREYNIFHCNIATLKAIVGNDGECEQLSVVIGK